MTKAVATTQGNAIKATEDQLPAGYDLDEMIKDAASNPQLTSSDVAIPYLVVLQTNSPQVNPAKSQFIEGASAGMFYNNVTNETYEGRKQGLIIVPCAYERKIMEWVHRDAGGGLVGEHALDSDIMSHAKLDEKNKPRLPNGNVLVETAYHYVIFQNPDTGSWSQAVLAFSSTFLKRNRKWNNLITTSKIPGTDHTAPRFLYAYNFTTEIESKGDNSWFVPDMAKIESPINLSLYNNAKKFAKMVTAGQVKVANEQVDPETGEITTEGVI